MTRALNVLRGQTYVWIKTLNPEIFWRYKSYIKANPWLHEHMRFISYLNLFRLIIVFGFFHRNGSHVHTVNTQNSKPHLGSESKYSEKSKLRTYVKGLLEFDMVIIDIAKVALIFEDDIPTVTTKAFKNPYINLLCNILWQNDAKILFHNNTELDDSYVLKLLKNNGYTKLQVPKDVLADPDMDFAYISARPSSGWSKKEPIQPTLKYYMDPILSGKRFRAEYGSELFKKAGFVQNLYLHNGLGDFSSQYESGFLYHSMPILAVCSELYKEYKNGNYAYIQFDKWSEHNIYPYFTQLFSYKPEPITAERRCLDFEISRAKQLMESVIRRLMESQAPKTLEELNEFWDFRNIPEDLNEFLEQNANDKTCYSEIYTENPSNPIGRYILATEVNLGIEDFFKEFTKAYDTQVFLNSQFADVQKDLFKLLDHLSTGDFLNRYSSQLKNTKSLIKSGPMEI